MAGAPSHTHSQTETAHGGIGAYVVGFGLSLVLTLLPFWLVMTKALPASALFPAAFALGGVQIVVHLVYFLHVKTPWADRWELRALLLTAVIVAIVILGSIWVLKELDDNMMPMNTMPMSGTAGTMPADMHMHMHKGQ